MERYLRSDLDPNSVRKQVMACLHSYEPRQEHKIGAVGFLLDLFFLPEGEHPGMPKKD